MPPVEVAAADRAVTIERDRADRAAAGRRPPRPASRAAATVDEGSTGSHSRHAGGARERVRALADHQDVLAIVEHAAGQGDRIGDRG